MSSAIRVSILNKGSMGIHKNLCELNEQYLRTMKDASSRSNNMKWISEGIDKYKRDVSKGSSFVTMSKAGIEEQADDRMRVAKAVLENVINGVHKGHTSMQKAGVTTSLGYNFIDLRGPSNLLYPVNTPFRDSIPRTGAVNAGVGTMAQWKTTRVVGSQYAGVPEGQRAQVATPDENNFASAYTALGTERSVTVEAEWAGEGFTGNLADEHLRGLQELWLQEEGIILLGNDGSQGSAGIGHNGFQLGTAPAPLAALAAGGAITTATPITGYVVLLTGLGNPSNPQYGYQPAPSVTNGLIPTFTVNAPGTGTSVTYNGGMSGISVASNTVTTASTNLSVKFTVRSAANAVGGYPNGTFGFAWFVSSNASPTLANAWLTAITQFPTFTLTTNPPTSGQAGNAAGLSTDHSAQPTDFTGLLSWAATYGYWKDLEGTTLTSLPGGRCAQVEAALEYFFVNYQAGVDAIWGSPDAIASLQNCVLANGSADQGGFQVFMTRDNQDNLIGGILVSSYKSRYAVASPTGANIIPLKMHPMIPPGTLYFDISKNPYPQSRIPATREIMLMRDYYGYEWPATHRAWDFGTYADETLGHYTPWLTGVITGIAES